MNVTRLLSPATSLFAFSVLACGASQSTLRSRAAGDLNCPGAALRISKIDGRTYSVYGCERRAVYVESCGENRWTDPCTWILNSEWTEVPGGEGTVSASTPGAAPPAPVKYAVEEKMPSGAAGFAFGNTIDEAQAACEGAGHSWISQGKYWRCSGTPQEIGLPLASLVGSCAHRLCEVILTGTLASTIAGVDAKFSMLENAMVTKYGPPQRVERNVPVGCETAPVSCTAEGRAHFSAVWNWEHGQQVELNLSQDGSAASLGIRYHML